MTEKDRELQEMRRENQRLNDEVAALKLKGAIGEEYTVEKLKKASEDDLKKISLLENEINELRAENDRLFKKTIEPEEIPNTSIRAKVLDAAKKCVCRDREGQYGSPEDNFQAIADLWNAYDGRHAETYTPQDVAIMMALLKIARIKTGRYKADSYIDCAGYIACGAEIAERTEK